MISISIKKLSKQRKIQIIIAGLVLLAAIAGSVTFLIVNKKSVAKKTVTTTKTVAKKNTKPTATTDDVQSDLNTINNKSSSLDSELTSASSGLSDQQANLTY